MEGYFFLSSFIFFSAYSFSSELLYCVCIVDGGDDENVLGEEISLKFKAIIIISLILDKWQ